MRVAFVVAGAAPNAAHGDVAFSRDARTMRASPSPSLDKDEAWQRSHALDLVTGALRVGTRSDTGVVEHPGGGLVVTLSSDQGRPMCSLPGRTTPLRPETFSGLSPPPNESYNARAGAFVSRVVKNILVAAAGAPALMNASRSPADAAPTMILRYLQFVKVEHRRGVRPDQVITPAPPEDSVTVGGDEGKSAGALEVRLAAASRPSERARSPLEELTVGLQSALYELCLPMATQDLNITVTKTGVHAGVLGAGRLILEHLFDPRRVDSTLEQTEHV